MLVGRNDLEEATGKGRDSEVERQRRQWGETGRERETSCEQSTCGGKGCYTITFSLLSIRYHQLLSPTTPHYLLPPSVADPYNILTTPINYYPLLHPLLPSLPPTPCNPCCPPWAQRRDRRRRDTQRHRTYTHEQPGTKLPKCYLALCAGPLGSHEIDLLRRGVELSGGSPSSPPSSPALSHTRTRVSLSRARARALSLSVWFSPCVSPCLPLCLPPSIPPSLPKALNNMHDTQYQSPQGRSGRSTWQRLSASLGFFKNDVFFVPSSAWMFVQAVVGEFFFFAGLVALLLVWVRGVFVTHTHTNTRARTHTHTHTHTVRALSRSNSIASRLRSAPRRY
jgi:hypothetical protein